MQKYENIIKTALHMF